jgi:hypothetical protein
MTEFVHKAVPESAESRQIELVSAEFEVITRFDEINCNTFIMETAQAIIELANSTLLIGCCFEVFS